MEGEGECLVVEAEGGCLEGEGVEVCLVVVGEECLGEGEAPLVEGEVCLALEAGASDKLRMSTVTCGLLEDASSSLKRFWIAMM